MGFSWMDGIGAIIISLYIYGVAYVSARESSVILLDSFNSPEILELVSKIVKSIPEVKDVSGVRLRRAGPFITGRAEITLNPQLTVEESDIIAERVSQVLSHNINNLRDFVVLVEPFASVRKEEDVPQDDKSSVEARQNGRKPRSL
ncbi:MAG: cation diffusion facilitator family transporter [Nitrososphaerales archaeon]